jgi:hypothetical protein
LNGTRHVHLENLSLRHARTAIRVGKRGEAGAVGLIVRRCKFDDVISGIVTSSENARDWYLADNELTGINPTWYPRPGDNKYMEPSHTGINVYGQGIVVCHNRIQRFSDALAVNNFGPPVDDVERHGVAIDFYGNDLSFAQDDCLETDYGCHNIRVYRNRGYNAHTGLSVQPSYGGPIYLIRNELFGITALPFKLHNYCIGMVVYHNTSCCAGDGFMSFNRWQNGHFRNNLILGGKPDVDSRGNVSNRRAISTGTMTAYSTLDYNGYRRNGPGRFIQWFDGQKQASYESLAEFAAGTGHEKHGVMVDYDGFVRAAPPERGKTTEPDQWDLRLRPGSAAQHGMEQQVLERPPGDRDAKGIHHDKIECQQIAGTMDLREIHFLLDAVGQLPIRHASLQGPPDRVGHPGFVTVLVVLLLQPLQDGDRLQSGVLVQEAFHVLPVLRQGILPRPVVARRPLHLAGQFLRLPVLSDRLLAHS